MPIINRVAEYQDELTAWRRHLHEHPELAFEEVRTAAFVADKLRSFGVDEVHTDIGKTDGNGWMVGPYISTMLSPNLFLDIRGMYGQSDNSSTQDIQNVEYRGDFETDRYLVEAILSGHFEYGGTVLTPDLQRPAGRTRR